MNGKLDHKVALAYSKKMNSLYTGSGLRMDSYLAIYLLPIDFAIKKFEVSVRMVQIPEFNLRNFQQDFDSLSAYFWEQTVLTLCSF